MDGGLVCSLFYVTIRYVNIIHSHKERTVIRKRNIVFGFVYLVVTAALGPYMVTQMLPTVAEPGKKTAVAGLQSLASNDFVKDLEPLRADAIANSNAGTLLALAQYLNAGEVVDAVKASPHAQ